MKEKRHLGGDCIPPTTPLRITGRAKRASGYWREAARFLRRLTPPHASNSNGCALRALASHERLFGFCT